MILDLVEENELPKDGLCNTLKDTAYAKTLKLFKPTATEIVAWYTRLSYWGADYKEVYDLNEAFRRGLTPTRITILLLIAAMHDEI